MNLQRVDEIIDSYGADRVFALSILQDIQAECEYLPREALERTAERLGLPLGEVHRLATFFWAFRLEQPPGERNVKVCLGTACHVRGGVQVLKQVEKGLHVKAGETTPDGKYSLEVVRCLGGCAHGPLVEVDGEHYTDVTPAEVEKIITTLK
jgi:NADH-quinone oxidoreductase subunit E